MQGQEVVTSGKVNSAKRRLSYEKTYGYFDNHTIHSRFLPAVSYEVPKGVLFLLFCFCPVSINMFLTP